MNRIIKAGVAALAMAAVAPAMADESENEGVIGWTPVAIGLATPVQLPWGLNQWDVFGLDINVFYTDVPTMYGVGIGGLGMLTRDAMGGLQVGGLFNYAKSNVYGMRATLGANISFDEGYGVDVGAFAFRKAAFWGLDIEALGDYCTDVHGMQVAGLANVETEMSYGWMTAGGCNWACEKAYGFQLAGLFNYAAELHGCQLALVNYARECPWGFQIGLVNIIMDNKVKVLPFFNAFF